MKILYVNDYWEFGGAERILQSLFKKAKEHGYEPIFYSKYSDIMNCLSSKLDIVHFHNISSIGIKPIEYCIDNNIPCLVTIHDYWNVCRNRELTPDKRLSRVTCDNNDWSKCTQCKNNECISPLPENMVNILNKVVSITVSDFQKRVTQRFEQHKGSDVRTIHNGLCIDCGWYNSGKYDYVFWFGIDKKEKNIDVFHNIAKQLGHKIPFIDIATSPIRGEDTRRKTEEEIKKLYADCLLFVMTSDWAEPNGLTQMQAQASGKAVVAYDVGGIREYLPSNCGILVEKSNEKGLKEAIEYLIDNPSIAKEMGENGRKNVEKNFTEDILWNNYNNVYNELIEKGKTKGQNEKAVV